MMRWAAMPHDRSVSTRAIMATQDGKDSRSPPVATVISRAVSSRETRTSKKSQAAVE